MKGKRGIREIRMQDNIRGEKEEKRVHYGNVHANAR